MSACQNMVVSESAHVQMGAGSAHQKTWTPQLHTLHLRPRGPVPASAADCQLSRAHRSGRRATSQPAIPVPMLGPRAPESTPPAFAPSAAVSDRADCSMPHAKSAPPLIRLPDTPTWVACKATPISRDGAVPERRDILYPVSRPVRGGSPSHSFSSLITPSLPSPLNILSILLSFPVYHGDQHSP